MLRLGLFFCVLLVATAEEASGVASPLPNFYGALFSDKECKDVVVISTLGPKYINSTVTIRPAGVPPYSFKGGWKLEMPPDSFNCSFTAGWEKYCNYGGMSCKGKGTNLATFEFSSPCISWPSDPCTPLNVTISINGKHGSYFKGQGN